jgi:hypothetical protein
MLLAGKGSVKWVTLDTEGEETGETTTIDLAEFVMRSLAHTLVQGGEPFKDVKKVADKYDVPIEEDTSFSVVFKQLGGTRRLTRRNRSKKQ